MVVVFLAGVSHTYAQRLYWIDDKAEKIQSVRTDGTDLRTEFVFSKIIQLRSLTIDPLDGSAYWTHSGLPGLSHGDPTLSTSATLEIKGVADPRVVEFDPIQRKLYIVEHGVIRRASPDGANLEDVVLTPSVFAAIIRVDGVNGWVYWRNVQNGFNTIRRARLNGADNMRIATTGITNILGIAIDPSQDALYYCDDTNRIRRVNLLDLTVTDIVNTGASNISGLVIHVDIGKLYWIDYTRGVIQRANLDGTVIEDVSSVSPIKGGPSRVAFATTLVIDPVRSYFYWSTIMNGGLISLIHRMKLDGSNPESVFGPGIDRGVGLAIDPQRGALFWSNYEPNSYDLDAALYRLMIGTGQLRLLEAQRTSRGSKFAGLSVDPATDRMIWFYFREVHEMDLSTLESDLLACDTIGTCRNSAFDATHQRSFYQTGTSLFQLDTNSCIETNLFDADPFIQTAVALDLPAEKIYWTQTRVVSFFGPRYEGRIQRANLDGTMLEELVPTDHFGLPFGLALDLVNRKMYWSDASAGRIERADLDGSNIVEIVSGLQAPKHLILDPWPAGDCDHDRLISSADATRMIECWAGPASNRAAECFCADIETDGYIDLRDFAALQRRLTR